MIVQISRSSCFEVEADLLRGPGRHESEEMTVEIDVAHEGEKRSGILASALAPRDALSPGESSECPISFEPSRRPALEPRPCPRSGRAVALGARAGTTPPPTHGKPGTTTSWWCSGGRSRRSIARSSGRISSATSRRWGRSGFGSTAIAAWCGPIFEGRRTWPSGPSAFGHRRSLNSTGGRRGEERCSGKERRTLRNPLSMKVPQNRSVEDEFERDLGRGGSISLMIPG